MIAKTFFALLYIEIASLASAEEPPFTIEGGLSPDGKLSVVVFGNVNWNSSDAMNATEKEAHAYLYNVDLKNIIGPLEEVDVDGGSWGTTRNNLQANWSMNSRFLTINFRCGRLNHDYVMYKIEQQNFKNSFRAIPQIFAPLNSGPNGSAVFLNATTGPNSGQGFEKWLTPTELSVVCYGMRPKDGNSRLSGWLTDQGQVRIIYQNSGNKWIIVRYEKVPDNY